MYCTAWTEIDLKALAQNYRAIKKLALKQSLPNIRNKVDILTVVKAEAYGHGMVDCAHVLQKEGVKFFAVSNIDEGRLLRESGIKGQIFLFETTLSECAEALLQYDLIPSLCTLNLAKRLNLLASRQKKVAPVHIKIDTGMGRLGVKKEDTVDFVKTVSKLNHIKVEGLLTHFPSADTDEAFTENQIDQFADITADLIKEGISFRYLHAANTMGLGYSNHIFNLGRPGVSLYGLYPSLALKSKLKLKPVMSVKARVLLLKDLKKGETVSYGRTFFAVKSLKTAIVDIGYSDGYPRAMSNRAHVLINGKKCSVLGCVTMDQIIVDVTRAGVVKLGDEVVVLGRQKKAEVTADDLAGWAGTINYEIVCGFKGLKRR